MDIRQQLLAAKKKIEKKSGYKFNKDALALADLTSEFVAIKVTEALTEINATTSQKVTVFGKSDEKREIEDLLYGE